MKYAIITLLSYLLFGSGSAEDPRKSLREAAKPGRASSDCWCRVSTVHSLSWGILGISTSQTIGS